MKLLQDLLSIVAPYRCLVCSQDGSLLCPACRIAEVVAPPPCCLFCGKGNVDWKVCASCRSTVRITNAWAAADYDGVAKQLITAYKFGSARSAGHTISDCMIDSIPMFNGYTIVPVPTITNHIRQRGFDHTKLLAKSLSTKIGLPYECCILRTNQNKQIGRHRSDRLKLASGGIRLINPKLILGQKILLIDDVMTTGATLAACAALLRDAGAKTVCAAVFARVI